MNKLTLALATIPALVLVPSIALADSNGPFIERPLTKDAGLLEIEGDVIVNLSKDRVAKPFAVAPDIYYGVNERLTLGLTHDLGVCLSGKENGCAQVYDDVGVKAIYGLSSAAALALAVHGELKINSIDTGTISLPVGLQGRYVSGKVGVYFDPTIGIGLTDRDTGNKETIAVPVSIAYQASPELMLHFDTGIGGVVGGPSQGSASLSEFGNTFAIPLGVGALYSVAPQFDIGATLQFPTPFGSDLANDIGFDARVLVLEANIRL